eukprot:3781412-Pleurochrysis_carterae.AAC.1
MQARKSFALHTRARPRPLARVPQRTLSNVTTLATLTSVIARTARTACIALTAPCLRPSPSPTPPALFRFGAQAPSF